MTFNPSLVYSNIKTLSKSSGVKLGDIEAAAGASPGYLSRIGSKEDDKTNSVVVDLLISASEKLNVSIETLISRDISQATETEKKIIQFIDKLTIETTTCVRSWNKVSEESFDGRLPSEPLNPLAVLGEYDEDSGHRYSSYFSSRFDDSAILNGSGYKTILSGNTTVYLFKTQTPSETGRLLSDDAYEFYLYHNSSVIPLYNCIKQNQNLFALAANLYKEAKASAKNGSLSYTSNSLIDNYLKN